MQNFKVSNIIDFTYPDDKRRFSLVDACCFVCWPLPSLYCFETIDGSRIIRVATLLQDWFFLPFLVFFSFYLNEVHYSQSFSLFISLEFEYQSTFYQNFLNEVIWIAFGPK